MKENSPLGPRGEFFVRLPGENIYCGDDFTLVGESVQGFFRKDQLAVDFHLENPAAGSDELRGELEMFLDFVSQTGCLGSVVSNLAILDGDLHGDPSRSVPPKIRTGSGAWARLPASFRMIPERIHRCEPPHPRHRPG